MGAVGGFAHYLLTKAFGTKDPTERAKVYNELATDMINDNVIVPVVNPNLFLAARKDIKGLYYSACCNLQLIDLSRG